MSPQRVRDDFGYDLLDSGNHRIQKFGPDGKDHKTIRFLEGSGD